MSSYKIGDLFYKSIDSYGILYTINFYLIVDISEEGYIIKWIEFIKEYGDPTNRKSCNYICRIEESIILGKAYACKYFTYNITGEIDFQTILKIKNTYSPELAYKLIHKKFQIVL